MYCIRKFRVHKYRLKTWKSRVPRRSILLY
jgi:hypothetical protein